MFSEAQLRSIDRLMDDCTKLVEGDRQVVLNEQVKDCLDLGIPTRVIDGMMRAHGIDPMTGGWLADAAASELVEEIEQATGWELDEEERQSLKEQVDEDTCTKHGLFCCPECFDLSVDSDVREAKGGYEVEDDKHIPPYDWEKDGGLEL